MSKDIRVGELILGKKAERKRVRRKIPKHIKELVWAKYIGINEMTGKCNVCGRPIHFTRFEVGHNKAVAKGGSDNINNLRPICRSCNLAMGTMSIATFKRKHFSKPTKKKVPKKRRKTKKKSKEEPFPSLADVILK